MEKFSQFRDRGSGISPFLPTNTPASNAPAQALHLALFLFRLPIFLFCAPAYFLVLQFLPLGQAFHKVLLWCLLGIPWIIWGDLQIDGVKRGSLSSQPPDRVPGPGSVIAASFTSPVDAVYLAAVFDPIFTVSFPGSRKLLRVSFFRAILHALSPAQLRPGAPAPGGPGGRLTDLRDLLARNPGRVVAVFPECATTNGRGILPFSPSLLAAPPRAKIFPVSIRYTPPDITTPVPGAWATFLWKLLSRPTHTIRIRIAECVYNNASSSPTSPSASANDDGVGEGEGGDRPSSSAAAAEVTPEEQRVLDRIAENLARLGRNKRVGLGVEDKARFVEAWKKAKRS